jgi:O-antigen/teichoic acid export membrane protein
MSLSALMLFPLCVGMAVAATQLVAVVLGPQWGPAASLVPWFALAGGCHVASQLSQSLAEARAELNRSVAVQLAYLIGLALLILLVLPFRSRGVWVIAVAVAIAELLRYLGYLILARRVLGLRRAEIWRAHFPAAFASAGVGFAIAGAGWALAGAPSLAVLAVQIIAGALALAICIRFCPVADARAELWLRLTSAGLLGAATGWRSLLARLVLGKQQLANPG